MPRFPPGGALVAKGRRIEIVSAVLPVTDEALDPSSMTAIPSLHATFRPDAVLALGVVANGDTSERVYRVELCATNRNLRIRDGRWLHTADAPRPSSSRPALSEPPSPSMAGR
jgi:hypothetical protein